MYVKIGYLGSKHSVEKMTLLAEEFDTIRLSTYIYQDLAEVANLFKCALNENDVICFSGILPYYYRDRSIKTEKLIIVTPFHEYMVTTTLLKALIHEQIELSEISLDLPDASLLNHLETDLQYKLSKSTLYDYHWIYDHEEHRTFPFQELVHFHRSHYVNQVTKLAITSIHRVYDELQQQGIPVMYMVDFNRNMRQVLQEAEQAVLFTRLQDGMFATITFTLQQEVEMDNNKKQLIISTLTALNPSLKYYSPQENDDRMTLFTTRGVIESSLLSNAANNWISHLKQQLECEFSFGIGYGRYLLEAEENANRALKSAKRLQESNGYMLTENHELIGPIIGNRTVDKTRISEEWLTELTFQTKTSLQTMLRFAKFIELHDYQPFTAKELTTFTQVSDRTTERFLKRLLDQKIVYIFAQEQTLNKGRPRNVYRVVETIENRFRELKKD